MANDLKIIEALKKETGIEVRELNRLLQNRRRASLD